MYEKYSSCYNDNYVTKCYKNTYQVFLWKIVISFLFYVKCIWIFTKFFPSFEEIVLMSILRICLKICLIVQYSWQKKYDQKELENKTRNPPSLKREFESIETIWIEWIYLNLF